MSVANRWLGLCFGLLLFILIPFFFLEETIMHAFTNAMDEEFNKAWFAGLIVILLALDLVLPVPSSIASTTAGAALGFGAGAITCWVGMSLGCVIGYWLGSEGGTPTVRRLVGTTELEKATRLGRRYGIMFLIVSRAVPVLAEVSVITAGVMRIPPKVFFIVTGFSNLGISLVYAGVGAFAFELHSFVLAFLGAILVPGSAMLVSRKVFNQELPSDFFHSKEPSGELEQSGNTAPFLLQQQFSVSYTYPVLFTHEVFDPGNRVLVQALSGNEASQQHDVVVYIDDGVSAAWPRLTGDIHTYMSEHKKNLRLVMDPISLPGGEQCKNDPEILTKLYHQLLQMGVDRHSFIIVIGGGAVLDTVGYAAATTHRGVRLVRLPTTVLAQNDSGVGVKTGINFVNVKNFIGAFAPPFAVINDFCFLTSLSPRDRRAGIAEAVKVALIQDRKFFEWLEGHVQPLNDFDTESMSYMIRHCASLHMQHIGGSGDPFESGNVRPLDYGHWSGHKLELLTQHELRHGEAVAIGMALDARYAVQIGLLPNGTDTRVCQLLENLGFQLWHPVMHERNAKNHLHLTDGLREFREHLGGALSVTLLRSIGECVEVQDMNHQEIERAIDWLYARYQRI